MRKYKVWISVCLVLLCISGCSEAGTDLKAAVFDGHTEGSESEYVEFGEYPKGKPIEWLVLDEKDGAKLLFSRYSLFFTAYNYANENVTWETSDLRAEMNGWFYKEAFSGDEKKRIQTVTLINDDSPGGTDGGNDTKDKVFIKGQSIRYARMAAAPVLRVR